MEKWLSVKMFYVIGTVCSVFIALLLILSLILTLDT